jgi:hypothetical protein
MAGIFIMTLARVTEDDVRYVFNELELGQIEQIKFEEHEKDGRTLRKFWIYYSHICYFVPAVKAFFDKIHLNYVWQRDGGEFRPPRIIFKNRNGTEQYWNAYYTEPRMRLDYTSKPRIEL